MLELVENRAAIAYFAVANRNQSLFNALKNFIKDELKQMEEFKDEFQEADSEKKDINKKDFKRILTNANKKKHGKQDQEQLYMENIFKRMICDYDFMSLVMYPELKKRREFVHDAWIISKLTENGELKIAISCDPYFYITRDDILQLLKTKDDTMIKHMLEHEIMLNIREDVSYKLVKIKGA